MSPRESHDDLDPGSAEDLLQELQGNLGQPPLTPKALHQLVQATTKRLWREGSFPVAPPAGSVWAVCLLPEETTVQVVRWDELPAPVRALEALALAPLPVLTFYFGRGIHSPGAQVELGECAHPLFRPPAESSSWLSDALDGAMAAGHFAQPPPPGTAWVLTGRPHRVLAHPPGTGKVLGLRLTVTAEPLGALDPRLVGYVRPGEEEGMALVLLTADNGGEPSESGVFYLYDDPLTVAPRGTA